MSEMHLGSTEYEKLLHFNFQFSSSSVPNTQMNEEYSDRFSELSGHSGSKEYESMAHVLLSFVGQTYEKWMDQQYTDLLTPPATMKVIA